MNTFENTIGILNVEYCRVSFIHNFIEIIVVLSNYISLFY